MKNEIQPWRLRKSRAVVGGVNESVVDPLGSDLEIEPESMASLLEIGVTQGGIEPKLRGIRAIPVVKLHASVERQGVFHLQIDIDRTRLDPGIVKRGRHLAVRPRIQSEDIGCNGVKVGNSAFRERGGASLDFCE